jgi:hypothetical protein
VDDGLSRIGKRVDGFGIQTLWSHAACLDSFGVSDLHVTRPEYWENVDAPETDRLGQRSGMQPE